MTPNTLLVDDTKIKMYLQIPLTYYVPTSKICFVIGVGALDISDICTSSNSVALSASCITKMHQLYQINLNVFFKNSHVVNKIFKYHNELKRVKKSIWAGHCTVCLKD